MQQSTDSFRPIRFQGPPAQSSMMHTSLWRLQLDVLPEQRCLKSSARFLNNSYSPEPPLPSERRQLPVGYRRRPESRFEDPALFDLSESIAVGSVGFEQQAAELSAVLAVRHAAFVRPYYFETLTKMTLIAAYHQKMTDLKPADFRLFDRSYQLEPYQPKPWSCCLAQNRRSPSKQWSQYRS